ncbi:hypothetical protein N8Z70_02570 [Candidatus Puniceispirillum sp.]|nr:hypothetical protein [Candidatus Puniceispirillum sp.]
MKKRTIILSHYKHISWLYLKILPTIKKILKARVVLLLPSDVAVPDSYEAKLDEGDEVVFVPTFAELAESVGSSENKLSENLDNFISKYNFNPTLDLLMQERAFAEMNTVGWRGVPAHDFTNLDESTVNQILVSYFQFFENVFLLNNVILALVWPRSCWEAVAGVIAHTKGILVTFPYPSKGYGRLGYWADGMFANSVQIKDTFYSQDATVSFHSEDSSKVTFGGGEMFRHENLSETYGLKLTVKRIILIFVNHFQFMLRDIRLRRFGRRISFRTAIAKEISNYFYWKGFQKLCVSEQSIDVSQRFVFFAFQSQPEFSVEGRCKEFNDQKAIIVAIAKSLPPGVILYIKEHTFVGKRTLNYYKNLLDLPSVKMVPPNIPAVNIAKHAECAFSLNGTILFELSEFGVPCAYFSKRSEFSVLENAFFLENAAVIESWIRGVLSGNLTVSKQASSISGRKFINAMRSNSFEAVPMYNNGLGDINEYEVERSVKLLTNLIAKFKTKKSSYSFNLSDL